MDKKPNRLPNNSRIPPLSSTRQDGNSQITHVQKNAVSKQVQMEVKQINVPNLKELKSIDMTPALVFSKIPLNAKNQDKAQQLASNSIKGNNKVTVGTSCCGKRSGRQCSSLSLEGRKGWPGLSGYFWRWHPHGPTSHLMPICVRLWPTP